MLPKTDVGNATQSSINYINNNLLNYFNMTGMLPANVFTNGLPLFGGNQLNMNQLLTQYSAQGNILNNPGIGLNLGVMGLNGLNLGTNQLFPKPIQNLFS